MGWSGSGKTTLIERMLPLLRAQGLRVSTIKHTHHDEDLDRPGKDSFRHRAAGAEEVMVVAGARWALLRETAASPSLEALAARLAPVDLVLVEGYRDYGFAKLEVHRPGLGKPALWPADAGVLAVASPVALPDCPVERLDLNDPEAIAEWVGRWAGRPGALPPTCPWDPAGA